MATSRMVVSPWSAFKRLRISPTPSAAMPHVSSAALTTSASHREEAELLQEGVPDNVANMIQEDLFELANSRNITIPGSIAPAPPQPARVPRAVTSLYSAPLRRAPTHNLPVADLQLRSYSARNLETMADFALRAAYYLNLPAKGPVPLPRITERWTVPRSVFVHKKAQENWERITMRRLVQIVDGDAESVRRWLAFVRRWQWYGVGIKANVWEWEGLEQEEKKSYQEFAAGRSGSRWDLFGRRSDLVGKEAVEQYMDSLGFAADEEWKSRSSEHNLSQKGRSVNSESAGKSQEMQETAVPTNSATDVKTGISSEEMAARRKEALSLLDGLETTEAELEATSEALKESEETASTTQASQAEVPQPDHPTEAQLQSRIEEVQSKMRGVAAIAAELESTTEQIKASEETLTATAQADADVDAATHAHAQAQRETVSGLVHGIATIESELGHTIEGLQESEEHLTQITQADAGADAAISERDAEASTTTQVAPTSTHEAEASKPTENAAEPAEAKSVRGEHRVTESAETEYSADGGMKLQEGHPLPSAQDAGEATPAPEVKPKKRGRPRKSDG